MDLSSIIIGPVVTEKAEAMKTKGTYVLHVHPSATKIDVKNALRRFWDIDVASVRVMRIQPKSRVIGPGKVMEKRHRSKRMIVTLAKKSKALDITAFRTS